MEFRLLGPLQVLDEERVLDVGGGKQRALLALLLLDANRVVSRERLIDALWEDEPTATARKALQVYVSQLRKLLGRERLQTKPPGYLLRLEPDELDLDRFGRLREEGRFDEALALWRGPPLAEFAAQLFAQAEIARLEELRLVCVEERLEGHLGQGRHAELVGELEALVNAHPLRERLRAQLMLALYRAGRQAEALEQYQQARAALVEELGIEPGRQLRELQQAILRQDPELDPAASTGRATETSRSALVGRELELAELVEGLDDAFAGRGRLFLLVGEPGIGKSRLAEELVTLARARGARVLIGRCWEAGGAPAYWPWVQSLRACIPETPAAVLRSQLGAGASELAQLLPELRELFPDLPEPPALESDSARFHLFEAASSFLTSAAQTRSLVLVLDDLHAADEPSLLLLQFLARELGNSRLLVVGAYRDVDPSPADPLRRTLAELAREPVTRRLALVGLAAGEVSRFIELAAGEPPNEGLVAAIHEETEGNPLFVGEIVRLLAAEGRLDGAGGTRLTIPQSVRDVIGRRLGHLSLECNRLLLLASVLGREFAPDALARLSGVTEEKLLDTLDEAMLARVVSDVPGSGARLRFAHVLIRDTLYEGLTTARRVSTHRLAVDALEAVYGDEPGPHLAELAHHAKAGNDAEKAVRYAQRGGDRALTLLAYEEAARLYRTAIDALSSTHRDQGFHCELLLSLGEAEARAGNTLTAQTAFLDAAAIARRLRLPRELARAAAGYGGKLVWARAGEDDRLIPLLEEGLAGLAEEDVELRARLLARLAGAIRDQPSRDRRDRLSSEAVQLARQAENMPALAYALNGRCAAIFAPDTVDECLALGSELCDVAEQVGDVERIVEGRWITTVALLLRGEVGEAEAELALAARAAEELREPLHIWQVLATQAMLALAAGRFSEAEELTALALVAGERGHPRDAIAAHRLQLYAVCDLRGGLEIVEPAIRESAAELSNRPVFRCVLAHLDARLGRPGSAERALQDLAEGDFSGLPIDQEWLYGMSLIAETCLLLGAGGPAAAAYPLLLPYAALNVMDPPEGIRGSVSRYLGLLAWTLGRLEDAARHFDDALSMNANMGARPWLAHARHDYARLLLARAGSGDRERASELLDLALETYRELGMKQYAAAAATALADGITSH